MRMLLLLGSVSCAFVAAGIGFGWSIFDLDDPALVDDWAGYGWLSLCLLAAGLVWDDLATLVADLFGPIRRRRR